MQNTDKLHIQHLAEICAQKGMQQVVISPGSRCAPLIIAFNRHPDLECFSIVDERSAAFFALGLAQQSQRVVGLICTSGSAVLNYAPAVAEAYYQKIPLVLLTADRPNEWIDQGENQSIQQYEVFKNYIKSSFQLPVNLSSKKDLWYCDRLVSEALNHAVLPNFGPVHINIPLREPLYNLVKSKPLDLKVIDAIAYQNKLDEDSLVELKRIWNTRKKKMIIVGSQMQKNTDIEQVLFALNLQSDMVILHESISNFKIKDSFCNIDPLIEVISQQKGNSFVPEIVITFGNGIVSKKLKFWLRDHKIEHHWHISQNIEHWDNFQALTKVIPTDIAHFFEAIKGDQINDKPYFEKWKNLKNKLVDFHSEYIEQVDYSDFKVFHQILSYIPENTNVHFGNSTPVRYANLLKIPNNVKVNANRGVSGIDGQVSTALGASCINTNLSLCITGDLAMMYDSNALWNNYLHPNFKIILINNDGGNIFKIIPGPDDLEECHKFFETKNSYSAKHLCKLHDLAYFYVENEDILQEELNAFFAENKKASLLEIKTDGAKSAKVLKEYFKHLSTL